MTLQEIEQVCKKGKVGMVPGWEGYIKYNFGLDELTLVNGDYLMRQEELKNKLLDRTDLYYII